MVPPLAKPIIKSAEFEAEQTGIQEWNAGIVLNPISYCPVRAGLLLFTSFDILYSHRLGEIWKERVRVRLVNECKGGDQSIYWKSFGGKKEATDKSLRDLLTRESDEESCRGKLAPDEKTISPAYLFPNLNNPNKYQVLVFYAGSARTLPTTEGMIEDYADGLMIKWKDFLVSELDSLVVNGESGILNQPANLHIETLLAIRDFCSRSPAIQLKLNRMDLGVACTKEGEIIVPREYVQKMQNVLNTNNLIDDSSCNTCKIYYSVPLDNQKNSDIEYVKVFFEMGPFLYSEQYLPEVKLSLESYSGTKVKQAVANHVRRDFESIITERIPLIYSSF